MSFPSPTNQREDRREVLLEYLEFFRRSIRDKATGLSDQDLRTSRLPSGWTPLELVNHLVHVERRWVVWGFEGMDVEDPWADEEDDHWHVDPEETADTLLAALDASGWYTREVVMSHALEDRGEPSKRWDGADPPPLERVLLHLVQEFARHTGHLDIVRELADGSTGE